MMYQIKDWFEIKRWMKTQDVYEAPISTLVLPSYSGSLTNTTFEESISKYYKINVRFFYT